MAQAAHGAVCWLSIQEILANSAITSLSNLATVQTVK